MTRPALIYVWTIIAAGTATLACAVCECQSANGLAFGVSLALALFASTRNVKLPQLTATLSPGFVFILISVATLSWPETVAIAAASGLVQCLWHRKMPASVLQIAFAAATMAIAGGLAHRVTWWLAARQAGGMVVVLGVAGVVLLVTNTLIVSTVLCLIQEASFYTAWRSLQLRAVPFYLAGGLLAAVWSQAQLTSSAGIPLLAAISVYLLSICYRELDASAA